MWDGPRPGPRGGPPFRGDPRGEMFEGRECPAPEFRGRDGKPMGHRPPDRPPMDMRRFDRPAEMRPREMEPLDIRGREPPRDFFRPGEEGDAGMRRRFDMEMRNKLQGPPDFMGPGRHPLDISGRDMNPRGLREPNDAFMGGRERERFRMDMPGFNEPPMDSRRRLPMDLSNRDEGFRDMRDRERPRMGMEDIDGFSMDMPPREREMMDFDRRGGTPLTPRGRFESDVDFRNRIRPSGEFRERERSPLNFRENDGVPMDARGRPDGPPDFVAMNRPKFRGGEGNFRDMEFQEQREPSLGFRGREEKPHSDEWHGRDMRDRGPFPPHMKGAPPFPKGRERFPPPRCREGDPGSGEVADFPGRERQPSEFPVEKDGSFGFPHPGREGMDTHGWERNPPPDHFPGRDVPPFGRRGPQEPPLPHMEPPPLNVPNRENEAKRWPRDPDPKQNQNAPPRGRSPFLRGPDPAQGKSQIGQDHGGPEGHPPFGEPKDILSKPGQEGGKEEFPDNSSSDCRDQDYRDIDYRTGSGRAFDYERRDQPGTEKPLKESKPVPPQRFNDPASQLTKDQDYRSASVKKEVSNTISITGIPKTATMEQILGAFAVRDGVPMQGMKIKNVVPGYSYDTAYVEFLNLEDAVHFMESNQGSLKVGTKTALMRYIQPDRNSKEAPEAVHKDNQPQEPLLPTPGTAKKQPPETANQDGHRQKPPVDLLPQGAWQRSSNLTPEAWQQQMDQQQQQQQQQEAESWGARHPRHPPRQMDPIFKESKTMIIKNVKPTTTVETILKALDPYAYLDERNVRLVRGKPMGAKCFCFVDMDSHEQVARLVEILTKPPPLMIDGVRVYVEIAKPLKNQNYRREFDQSNTSLLGYPPDAGMMEQYYPQPAPALLPSPAVIQGDPVLPVIRDPIVSSEPQLNSNVTQGVPYAEPSAIDHSFQAPDAQVSMATPALAATAEGTDTYNYATETPDMSTYLYDATSGFYYDPQTTLYYDPSSRYFYNAQTQQYLYWDTGTKAYIPVPGYTTDTLPPAANAAVPVAGAPPPEAQTAEGPLDGKKVTDPGQEKKEEEEAAARPEKKEKEKEKEEKPRSLAAFKIMKDMERWAKIQNRQKDSVRAPSPVLKIPGAPEDRKSSKAADAAFAIFERKGIGGDDLFKKPMAPPKKEEKGLKRPMGSLGLLAADYGAGSDEEEEEKHEAPRVVKPQLEEKEDKLTDWKKMACLLCRRQFPNKDALVRHQQLSDLHKQNMEIHLKIKRSKKELEALENQEKQLSSRETRDSSGSPEVKRKKYQNSWSNAPRDMHKTSERPGLGAEPVERKKKEPVVWNHATYKQAVRKAMFARFKELE
ncbi:RNA-binding protein 5 isoform X1 [Anguilla anguilla]|uniref:RNA-binding protein 5 isoform X1 n=1 Tax=Anguilla anguilla TaxID=7936 RepID=UPI0015A8136E|nr:RNA-binding protein 5 isoform X1 [Anguilla anguilla]